MKHLVTIIGARPQFIKASILSRLIRSDKWCKMFNETLIHTGQHYDLNMSEIFFREMHIPKPDVRLNIGGESHGRMVGRMLIAIEKNLQHLKPDMVLVYGDTNTTLAGALSASKLNIPVVHIEAGLRSYNKSLPEEQNRIITDHLSQWLLCPTETAVQNLFREGINEGVFNVGDIMLDASLYYSKYMRGKAESINMNSFRSSQLSGEVLGNDFVLATIHRAENTDNPAKIATIVDALNEINTTVVLPLHPRTRKIVSHLNLRFNDNVIVIEPVGYLEMIGLEMKCKCVITDSGGIQKEAYFFNKPCITLREQTEWTETVDSGNNTLAGTEKDTILKAYNSLKKHNKFPEYYGDGNAGEKILELLIRA